MQKEIKTLSGERLLTKREAAKMLNVSEVTMLKWVNRGVIAPVQYGLRRFYRESDIRAILEGRQM